MLKSKFNKIFKEYQNKMLLWWWDIKMEITKDIKEWILWTCDSDFLYTNAHIKFSTKLLEYKDEKYIRKVIIHELLHCYMWFYRSDVENLSFMNSKLENFKWIKKDKVNTFINLVSEMWKTDKLSSILDKEEIATEFLSRIIFNGGF